MIPILIPMYIIRHVPLFVDKPFVRVGGLLPCKVFFDCCGVLNEVQSSKKIVPA